MKVDALRPVPTDWRPFRRSSWRHVPAAPGCYVLATIANVVLYAGLTVNLRIRLEQHLDNPDKTAPTALGRPLRFFWLETPDLEPVERGWLNAHTLVEGALPLLNKVQSPLAG